jgi:hypothetical protein
MVNHEVLGTFAGANFNIISNNNSIAYVGLVAYAGSGGNTLFIGMSLGLHKCSSTL